MIAQEVKSDNFIQGQYRHDDNNLVYDNHTICIETRTHKDSDIDNMVKTLISDFKDICLDADTTYILNVVKNNSGELMGRSFVRFNDKRLYNSLIGYSLDGSKKVDTPVLRLSKIGENYLRYSPAYISYTGDGRTSRNVLKVSPIPKFFGKEAIKILSSTFNKYSSTPGYPKISMKYPDFAILTFDSEENMQFARLMHTKMQVVDKSGQAFTIKCFPVLAR